MSIRNGGVWVLLINDPEMRAIIRQVEEKRRVNIQAIQCDTVEDAVKMNLLLQAFDAWTVEGIREFMKWNKNFPKVVIEE